MPTKYDFKLNGINEPKEMYVTCSGLCDDHRVNLIQKIQFPVEISLYSVDLVLLKLNN